jgi:hypothetical protein
MKLNKIDKSKTYSNLGSIDKEHLKDQGKKEPHKKFKLS